jgi:hypothetical protein
MMTCILISSGEYTGKINPINIPIYFDIRPQLQNKSSFSLNSETCICLINISEALLGPYIDLQTQHIWSQVDDMLAPALNDHRKGTMSCAEEAELVTSKKE